MQRLVTAAVGVPLTLAAVFFLPGIWFFAIMALLIEAAVAEYVAIVRPRAPHAPLRALLLFVPIAAAGLAAAFSEAREPGPLGYPPVQLLLGGLLLSVGVGSLLLAVAHAARGDGLRHRRHRLRHPLLRAADREPPPPAAARPLDALPAARHRLAGDTAAYYFGSSFGRHKMAPVVRPKKTWEGAVAGLAVALVAAAVWSVALRRVRPGMLVLAAMTGVAAQVGDLVESMIKRGAGVKDSGRLFPGHGGMLDRMDAMLAAPVLLLGAGSWETAGLKPRAPLEARGMPARGAGLRVPTP